MPLKLAKPALDKQTWLGHGKEGASTRARPKAQAGIFLHVGSFMHVGTLMTSALIWQKHKRWTERAGIHHLMNTVFKIINVELTVK